MTGKIAITTLGGTAVSSRTFSVSCASALTGLSTTRTGVHRQLRPRRMSARATPIDPGAVQLRLPNVPEG